MDDETTKAADKLQKIIEESSSVDEALQLITSDQTAMEKAMAAIAIPSVIDKTLLSFSSHNTVMEKAMAAIAIPSVIDKTLLSFSSHNTVMDKAMAAIARPSAIDKTLLSFSSHSTVMDKAMAAIARPSVIDKALLSFSSHQTAMGKAMAAIARPSAINKALLSFSSHKTVMDKSMAAIARPSAIDKALQSITTNQVFLEHAIIGFAKASAVILSKPSYLSEMAEIVSSIDFNTIDVSSFEECLEKAEDEFSSEESKDNFVNVFSNLHPLIQALLFYFLIHVFMPQVNSISANLLTPMVESYLDDNERSDRQKIKEIKNIPLPLKDVNTDDLRFITGNNVHLRASPSTNSEVYDELILGQVVTVLSKQKNWIEVVCEYKNGESMSGWVFTRYTAKFIK